jgi:hypothetical protein
MWLGWCNCRQRRQAKKTKTNTSKIKNTILFLTHYHTNGCATLQGLYSRVKEIAALLEQNLALAGLVSLSFDQLYKYISLGAVPTVSPTATFEPLSWRIFTPEGSPIEFQQRCVYRCAQLDSVPTFKIIGIYCSLISNYCQLQVTCLL